MSRVAGLARTLRALSAVPSQLAREGSDAINAQWDDQFARGVDPYERAWADLAKATLAKGRTPPPLTDTGAMRDGTLARPRGGAGIQLEAPWPAAVHQTGTAIMPARRVIPDAGMPATWRAALQRVFSRLVSR